MQKRHQSSINIIGPQYRIPHFVDLAIVRKVTTLTDNFTVTDINGKIFFNLKPASLVLLYDHRLLLDAAGKTVGLTLQRKVKTRHDRWEAFRVYDVGGVMITMDSIRSGNSIMEHGCSN
ncbi:protein LURP-one-related 15-like isoform X2 [Cicer arietinum]|uniref:Protein LURP-one-related 15-like n=1 Tax=Cicer arietinum TaxID=3827 RepID=A0A1S3EIC2_CICAR|nr:protein LURP-one-related 15-like [Cicer arietinum]